MWTGCTSTPFRRSSSETQGHSGALGADGNVGWKPGHGGIPTGPRA